MSLTSDEYLALDRQSVWHPFTRHSTVSREAFPIIVKGEGPWLFDNDGNRYVDAISSWWCCNLGHGHPRLLEAIREQIGQLQHSILANLSHPRVIKLATNLIGYFPDRYRRVLFASDGACAVEAAMRVAVQYWYNLGQTGKNRFAALQAGYHGDTFGAMSLGFMPNFHAPYRNIVMPVYHADRPFCAGCVWDERPETCQRQCLGSLRQILREHHSELAGLVVEPHCQGAAGMRIYSPCCLREMEQLCRQYKVLLIADEIAVGMGRTGRMFSCEHAGVDPDIVCLGKGLSGGYLPVSAAVVKEKLFDTFTDDPVDHTLYHGHTFAGNPLGAAAALACLEVYTEEKIVEEASRKGELLNEEFTIFQNLEEVENLRSLGMIAAFDLRGEKNGVPAAELARAVQTEALNRGVLLRPLDNVIYLMLPLVVDEEVMRETVQAIYEAVKSVLANQKDGRRFL